MIYLAKYQWKVLPFELATFPRLYTGLTKPILLLANAKVSVLLSIWMMSWSWFALRGKQEGMIGFVFLLVCPGLHIDFSKCDLHLPQNSCFLGGLCWDTVNMSVSLPTDKLADIQKLALFLLQKQHVWFIQSCLF